MEPPEQALLDHACAGTLLDLVGDGPVDREAMKKWGSAHTVRPAVLRHLLVEPQWPMHCRGVRLRGARISGPLDLESATLRCPLLLEDCYLDSPDPVTLNYATVPRIGLCRCWVVGGLTADLLVVTKEVDFSGSTFEGVVRLLDADITGQLCLGGAQLTRTDDDGDALIGDRMKVGGDVVLGQFLDQEFTAAGAVRLAGADIIGQLDLSAAQLTGTDRNGNALVGDGIKAGSGMALQKFTAVGAVRLPDADITGPLSCHGAQLNGTDRNGDALIADRMKVSGSVFLDQGFTAAGAVSVAGARIGESLRFVGAKLAGSVALKAGGVHVAGRLQWAPRSPVQELVDLERAAVHRLDDDWSLLDDQGVPDAHWPPKGQLRLAGFTYDGFGGQQQASLRQRLDWIRRSHTTATADSPAAFAAQPYEQLARIYRQTGQETEARKVAIARRNDLRCYGSLTRPRKLLNWLWDKTIKHGYQPLRAVVLLILVYASVLLVTCFTQHQNSMIVPAKDTKNITPTPTALHCSPAYPCFYPAGYAVDVVVPIINLRQAENWRPNGQACWGSAYIAFGWVATGFGWTFTTLAVAGYTGLIRKD